MAGDMESFLQKVQIRFSECTSFTPISDWKTKSLLTERCPNSSFCYDSLSRSIINNRALRFNSGKKRGESLEGERIGSEVGGRDSSADA
jgi:hypothetical protein